MTNDPTRGPFSRCELPMALTQRWTTVDPSVKPDEGTSGPPSTVGTAEFNGRPVAITTAGDTVHLRDLTDGRVLRGVRLPDAARVTQIHPVQREGSPAVLIKHGTSTRRLRNNARVLDIATATWLCALRSDISLARVHPGIFIVARGEDPEPNHITVGTLRGQPFALTTPSFNTHTMWSYDLTTGDPITAAYIDGAVLGVATLAEPEPHRDVAPEHPLVLIKDTRQHRRHLVRTYDLRTRQWRGEFPTRACAATATRLNESTVVVTRNDHNVQVWDLVTESRLGTTIRHAHPVTDMVIATTQECPVLITGSVDNTVRAWTLDTGELLAAITLSASPRKLSAHDNLIVCDLRRGAVTTVELTAP